MGSIGTGGLATASPDSPQKEHAALQSPQTIDVSRDQYHPHANERQISAARKQPTTPWGKFWFWVQDRDVHVWIMSLGFALLFTSYPIQGVQTIRYPDTGSYILIVLYSGYFVTSMWATFFLDWWGLEWCLPWGPISYATWIACEFSGVNSANLVGAAFFGWGAGILWPAAGQLIATVSTPHNRASNAGIYQCAFHVGVWAGGLILGAVIKAFPNYNDQYAVFIGLCCSSVICFTIHAFTFRRRFRSKTAAAGNTAADRVVEAAIADVAGQQPSQATLQQHNLHRVQLDDGTVEYRQARRTDVKSETAVVSDLALAGGRNNSNQPFSWKAWGDRMYQPVQMLWNPVFGPLAPAIFITGGMTQGWFNASFNLIVNAAGNEWNGWIYAISESVAIVMSVVLGLFYDKLRKNYQPHRFRWPMYVYVVAYYGMCGSALGAYYMAQPGVGYGPGQTDPGFFYGILSLTGGLYNLQLLCLEVSILTYLTTFLTYNCDIAFSSKIGMEAAGYLLTFGLVNVLDPHWMLVVLFCMSVPSMIIFLAFWHAPLRPVATLVTNEAELSILSDDTDVSNTDPEAQLAALDYSQREAQLVKGDNGTFDYVKGLHGKEFSADNLKSESGDTPRKTATQV